MGNATDCLKQLISDIATDRQSYIELNQLLEQQRQLIITRQTTELEALNGQLISIYQHLAQRGQQRYALLQQLGVTATARGIQMLISRLPASHQTKVNALWQDLQQQTLQAKNINEGNGALLSMQQEILQNLINSNGPENGLYQPI